MKMKRQDVNIRDPFVLVHDGKYYLYGTRSESCWDEMDGFDCYVSPDLENFEGPVEIFHKPEGFFADRFYWAPECYAYRNAFYLVTTLGSGTVKKGIYVLRADAPTGPFEVCSGRITPEDWTCIDGTLLFEDDVPYLVYSHAFEDGGSALRGEYCMQQLSPELDRAVSEPVCLFCAADTAWAKPFPYAEQEFGISGDCYFSDGACLKKGEDGRLYMIFSSWSVHGYAVGVAVSDSGRIAGPWRQQDEPLYPENGGHGMFFKDLSGNLIFTLHAPNDKYMERPVFYRVRIQDGRMSLA